MASPVVIRPYRSSDLAHIKALTVEAFDGVSIDQNIERHLGEMAGHDWQWRKVRHIDQDVIAAGAVILVAENHLMQIVGYVTTRMDRNAGIGLIPNMAVCAGERGNGIGRTLIHHALELFRTAGLEAARIETLEQNAIGQHLYPACGFVEVARQINYVMRLSETEIENNGTHGNSS